MEEFEMAVIYILGGLLGLCVGSFLNVVIYRVPIGMSIASPPSHCTKCGYRLRWYDNIPLLSYTFLGGKCRSCKTHISFRYTAVELANTVLWLGSVYAFWESSIPYACICAAACSIMLCIFFIDLEHMLIPDRFQIMLGVLGIATVFLDPEYNWLSHLIGAAAAALIFWGVAFFGEKKFGREALGGGDIKLGVAAGLLLGWQKLLIAMIIATVGGSIILLILRKAKHQGKETEYPFAPFITVGVAAALFFGNALVNAYLGLIGLI